MLSWDSYYEVVQDSVFKEIEESLGLKLPKCMKLLYKAGDAPFIDEPEDKMAVYRFTEDGLEAEFGSAMYFFRADGGSVSENIKLRKWKLLLVCPITVSKLHRMVAVKL